MWSMCGEEWAGGGEGGLQRCRSLPPPVPCIHGLCHFFPWFSPFRTNYFRHQNLIKDFARLISEGKCSQNSPAIAEAELACGKGTVSLFEIRISKQGAKKVVSNSPGLVDSVFNLPYGQVKYFEEFNAHKNCEINPAHQKILGASGNDIWT